MSFNIRRLLSWCVLLAVLGAVSGCKVPSAMNVFSLGKAAKTDVAESSDRAAAAAKSPYPGMQTSYQATTSRAVPQVCGAG
jgi:hypothetical protein